MTFLNSCECTNCGEYYIDLPMEMLTVGCYQAVCEECGEIILHFSLRDDYFNDNDLLV